MEGKKSGCCKEAGSASRCDIDDVLIMSSSDDDILIQATDEEEVQKMCFKKLKVSHKQKEGNLVVSKVLSLKRETPIKFRMDPISHKDVDLQLPQVFIQ